MPLELIKEFNTSTQAELETRLDAARVQRLMLRIQFKEAFNLKLAVVAQRTKTKLGKQLEIFAKEIRSVETAIEKATRRSEQIQNLMNEVGYLEEQMAEEG